MNELISILLLITYGNTSFGVTINLHYYGRKFSGLALSNFGGAVQSSRNHNEATDKDCYSKRAICAKTNSHRAVQKYWKSQGTSSFILPHHFEKKQALNYARIESINSYYSSPGFTRNPSSSFLAFICNYRI